MRENISVLTQNMEEDVFALFFMQTFSLCCFYTFPFQGPWRQFPRPRWINLQLGEWSEATSDGGTSSSNSDGRDNAGDDDDDGDGDGDGDGLP